MLTTDGITFSSIGARLGSAWAVLAEEVSAALADIGLSAIPRLNATALNTKVVFFIARFSLVLATIKRIHSAALNGVVPEGAAITVTVILCLLRVVN
ncbi:hypothetical protein STA22820_27460 [Edwardsiella ictaluri]|nr:hypothetical protein STU22726_27540 [Edwardsiella ictaluri]BEI13900.1 hypothetical protein STU22816_27530 [Edwardsiella ictaluri]BEI17373.1 hypothetical protein STA22820_27460 [Edwardsiella ictaluri]BEI20863.1 hypothetical protein STH22820_27630 [Edwardsiella ictaluri]